MLGKRKYHVIQENDESTTLFPSTTMLCDEIGNLKLEGRKEKVVEIDRAKSSNEENEERNNKSARTSLVQAPPMYFSSRDQFHLKVQQRASQIASKIVDQLLSAKLSFLTKKMQQELVEKENDALRKEIELENKLAMKENQFNDEITNTKAELNCLRIALNYAVKEIDHLKEENHHLLSIINAESYKFLHETF